MFNNTMKNNNTRQIGDAGESLVCDKLEQKGFEILHRNYRVVTGEIDIIAKDHDTLCFIEVRTRENIRLGHPAETVSKHKIRTIRRTAEFYLAQKKIRSVPIRFDVATIIWESGKYEYFSNAF